LWIQVMANLPAASPPTLIRACSLGSVDGEEAKDTVPLLEDRHLRPSRVQTSGLTAIPTTASSSSSQSSGTTRPRGHTRNISEFEDANGLIQPHLSSSFMVSTRPGGAAFEKTTLAERTPCGKWVFVCNKSVGARDSAFAQRVRFWCTRIHSFLCR
jgi:hypothetical protein